MKRDLQKRPVFCEVSDSLMQAALGASEKIKESMPVRRNVRGNGTHI